MARRFLCHAADAQMQVIIMVRLIELVSSVDDHTIHTYGTVHDWYRNSGKNNRFAGSPETGCAYFPTGVFSVQLLQEGNMYPTYPLAAQPLGRERFRDSRQSWASDAGIIIRKLRACSAPPSYYLVVTSATSGLSLDL